MTFFKSLVLLIFLQFSIANCVSLDGTDINMILNDPYRRQIYFDCLRGHGTCTSDGEKLKGVFKQVLLTGKTDSDDMKVAARTIIEYLANHLPEVLKDLTKQYAPKTVWQRVKGWVKSPITWIKKVFGNDSDASTVSKASSYKTSNNNLTASEEEINEIFGLADN